MPRPHMTQAAYQRALERWVDFLMAEISAAGVNCARELLWSACHSHARAWQVALEQEGLKAATVNHLLASVSSFYEFALERHLAPEGYRQNPFRGALRRASISNYASARVLTLSEYRKLLAWLEEQDEDLLNLRAHALIRTLLHTGWRAGELLAMRAGDLSPARGVAGALTYRFSAQHSRSFEDMLPADCVAAIEAYLACAGRPLHSLARNAFIWTPVRAPDLSGLGVALKPNAPITVRTAQRVVRTQLRAAGISGATEIRLHDLRHTYAFLLLQTGASAETIARRLRHGRVQSTTRYLRAVFMAGEAARCSAAISALRYSDAP